MHDGELLAAEPADQIVGAELGTGGFGENLQHVVADGMAEAIVDRLEVVEIGEQHRDRQRPSASCRLLSAITSSRKARRLAMPVSGSISAAVLWRSSVRSFAIASRMKAMAMVNSSASKLSTVSHTLSNTWLLGDQGSTCAKRRAQQEQRAVREQHEDRGPTRHQRLAAAAPEFVGRGPGVGGDDAGREQHWRPANRRRTACGRRRTTTPRRRPDTSARGARPSNTRAPDQVTAKAVNKTALAKSIEITSEHRAVHSEQHDRRGAQQMRAAPPCHGVNARILDPGEQQQQTEHGLDIDRDEKQRVDVESHRPIRLKMRPAQNLPVPTPLLAFAWETTGECTYGDTAQCGAMVSLLFPAAGRV